MDTDHGRLQPPLQIWASVCLCFFLVNKYCKETCLIPAQISCRFPVSQLGIGEIECWNIYLRVAYSAEGPLCMRMWSFTTRSQIKYLSRLNKKASVASRRAGACAPECMTRVASSVLSGWLVWSPKRWGRTEPVRMKIWVSPPYLLFHRDWNQPWLNQCTAAPEWAAVGGGGGRVWADAAVHSCSHKLIQMAPNLQSP